MATQTATTFTTKSLTFSDGKEKLSASIASGKFKPTGIGASADALRSVLPQNESIRAKFKFSGKFSVRTDSEGTESWYALGQYSTEVGEKTIRGTVKMTLGQVYRDGAFEATDGDKLERLFSLLDKAREERIDAICENRDNPDSGIRWIPVIPVFG